MGEKTPTLALIRTWSAEFGCFMGSSYPKGPRTQIIGFYGPNTIHIIFALKPYYLELGRLGLIPVV